ncbi:MAG: NUDIX hydrolase [Candidatus Buchananbacteria bacterium]
MKRIFYKLVNPIRKLYWFVFRPKTAGVKVLVEYDERILMIKNAYGKSIWTFPGGAVKKNELPENAAKREVAEEVGLKLHELISIGQIQSTREHKKDTIYCYSASSTNEKVEIDPSEIQTFNWFNKNELPSEISSIAQEIISLYLKK